MAEIAEVVSSVVGFSADLPDQASNVPIVEEEVVEEELQWNWRDLTFKDDREPFPFSE